MYTIIPDLPDGGPSYGYPVDVINNLLVLEQDITRKIAPLQFLSNSIPQLTVTTNINGANLIPLSDATLQNTSNLTINSLMEYINTHLNVIDVVFFVSSETGVDSMDFAERGRNEQLPFKSIKFAALQISNLINVDNNYDKDDPNFVIDTPAVNPGDAVTTSRKIRKQYTIMVRSGDYVEINPIYLPPNTSLIGDNLRRTTIRPYYPQLDLFWVDSANYIWGFTFRGHKSPSAAVAFPISTVVNQAANAGPILSQYAPQEGYTSFTPNSNGWVQDSYYNAYLLPLPDVNLGGTQQAIHPNVVPYNRPFIYTSPYVQGCTSYAVSDRMPNNDVGDNTDNPLYPTTWTVPGVRPPDNAGCGMRIDGSLVNGFIRSMVIDSYTQINQGGKGVYLLNHGYAQFVSTFTVACSEGIVCEAGATCSISTSNSTFGLSGLVARGMSFSEVLTGSFVIPNTNAYPLSSASTANGNTFNVYGYSVGSNLFTINSVTPYAVSYPYDDVSDIAVTGQPMTVASNPYATLCFTIGDDKPWITHYDGTQPVYSGPGYIMEEQINPTNTRTYGEFLNANSNFLNPQLSASSMHQVKLFYIEQGAPTPSLSGGSSLNNGNYDIYQRFKLTYPTEPNVYPQIGLPWDIDLSFNLSLDLTKLNPLSAYDVNGNPLHYKINYLGLPEPINYTVRNIDGVFSTISNNQNAQSTYTNNLNNGLIDFTNAPVKFYARSVLETGSHTFEYMGVGTRMKYAIPAFGGVTQNGNESIADGFNDKYGNAPGIVFFTSTNELGNFKVGTDFTIVQSTGTIEGQTFSRSILTLVTPLNIVLE